MQNNMPHLNPANAPTLPCQARSSFNRCNLPAIILGSLTFQQHPVALYLDNVAELHRQIFSALDSIDEDRTRAIHFMDYMRSSFLLDNGEEAGFDPERVRHVRVKANYLRLLRGWMFSSDGIEAAVLKRWVESRFGLLTQNHRGALVDYSTERYRAFQRDYLVGLYNANALESQLDMLYSYCQYELKRRMPKKQFFELYRGVNSIDEHEIVNKLGSKQYIILLNNLNSFSGNKEYSDVFGDYLLLTAVPLSKLLYFPGLLPGVLQGEEEYMVLGGVYKVSISC
ncbi:NAD+---dinitrogen-reductase ADP-D-ribosyltransferase [Alteromonadaceae bacterium Bs31]|nr:NAD+---dinitrogen-reductase ADP-D-ribosyltransferase [Alteromonadaceae bacterium Bs31]